MMRFLLRKLPPTTGRDRGATRFVITCAGRTGSTFLRMLLNSHPEIRCHGEVFTPDRIVGFVPGGQSCPPPEKLTELRQLNVVEFFHDYVLRAGLCKAVGAKIKYSELEMPQWQHVFREIRGDSDIRIIHLIRENRLKRYVSECIAAMTNVRLARRLDEIPPPVRLRLSPQACLQNIRSIEQLEERFRNLFRQHRVFEMTYEQMIDRASGQIEAVQRFLGVEPMPLDSVTLKLNSDNLEDLIENYREIEEAFRATAYERYFQPRHARQASAPR
jgi:LPS sulfotransferase NodH